MWTQWPNQAANPALALWLQLCSLAAGLLSLGRLAYRLNVNHSSCIGPLCRRVWCIHQL